VSEYSLKQGFMVATITDKQHEIINAAISLVAEKGIQRLTIKYLVKE
jgi:hypothetical protein